MGYSTTAAAATTIGKYQLKRTIGEGTFAKVKLAVNRETNAYVAVKIIDKAMVVRNNLMYQVKREIRTMKLLHHPNIVKIHEVIATKTKIYLVMEYVSGGQLSNKLEYINKLDEREARKYFQQLIDAMDYFHSRGVYHRDLKPENLLLDSRGDLKVSDFGLSVLRRPGDLLSTACGSPSYVAPEVIIHRSYDGAAADIWSCGVILFELLAGFLPFEDRSLVNLYRKISRAEYRFPDWFTNSQKKFISRILEPFPTKRATVSEIIEHEWFRIDYRPHLGVDNDDNSSSSNYDASIQSSEDSTPKNADKSWRFINAFQLIAMSNDLDLSGLFQEQKTKLLGSEHPMDETFTKIEVAAKDAELSVKRISSSRVRLLDMKRRTRSSSRCTFSAEVVEVTPKHCFVEVSQSAGDLTTYKEFCKSLSSLLMDNYCNLSEVETSRDGENDDSELMI
ncbi:CBL-interacting serine/threonine-protein kinase 21 isoform X2 [Canna indica]|uniref:non-specific serine/threonine protein kinase n=1 Tax=Canna indica TaxID=4628 RepID=A0AAQ3QLH4_9LILI|nr:CBL-interacting serine/threonine-protein kinase 21 isoform X2 [Canna indica]